MTELNLNDLTSITMKLPEGVLKGENVDVYDTATGQQLNNVVGISIVIEALNTKAVATFTVNKKEFQKTVDLVIEFVEPK